MDFYRVYTGDDGESHLEQLDSVSVLEITEPQPAANIVFREAPPGNFIDWHPAPRRQYIIQLAGEVEIGFVDRSSIRYRPGDVRLVEDTTGRGHTTTVVSAGPSITAVVPLAD